MSTDTENTWATDADSLDGGFMPDDFDAFDPGDTEPESESRPIDKIGYYHLAIQDVIPKPETCRNGDPNQPLRPHLLLVIRVMKSVKGQSPEGSVYFHTMNMKGKGGGPAEDWAVRSNTNFLTGIGIMKSVPNPKGEGNIAVDAETGSGGPKNLISRLKGIHFIGHIKCNKSDDPQYQDKYELTFGKGAYRIDDPAVADVPKNLEALKEIGITLGDAGQAAASGTNAGQSQSAQSQSSQQPPTEPEVDLNIDI